MTAPIDDRPLAIGLVGTFDVDNYGDCLFPEVYAWQIARHLPGATFTLYSPFPKVARILSFDRVEALPARLDQARFAEDCLILIGGETVSVGHNNGSYILPLDTLGHYLRMWLAPTVAAANGGTRFIVHSAGLRQHSPDSSLVIGRVLEAASHVTMRDRVSVERLGGQFGIAVDPVFLLPEMLPAAEWTARALAHLPAGIAPGSYLAVQASHAYIGAELDDWCHQVARVLHRTGRCAVLVPVCHFMEDGRFLALARERLAILYPDLARIVHCLAADRQNVKDTAALIARSAGYIGTSLHGAVTAAAFALPMAVYSGAGKEAGKHGQTMLAAGIDTGIFHAIPDLDACFARSQESPLKERAAHAQDLARQGVEAMCRAILEDKPRKAAIAPADIAALLREDRSTALSRRLRFKRGAIMAMRKVPGLYETYRSFRLKRLFPANIGLPR